MTANSHPEIQVVLGELLFKSNKIILLVTLNIFI